MINKGYIIFKGKGKILLYFVYNKKAQYFTKKYANDEPPKNLKHWDFTLGEDFYANN